MTDPDERFFFRPPSKAAKNFLIKPKPNAANRHTHIRLAIHLRLFHLCVGPQFLGQTHIEDCQG
ncbi:MAG: hypothetical protein LBJ64_10325, partial [Deltaproteobacteria bacterium]|nr:hypothetical protein [Deltaproteobacteria bacterium]